VNSTTLRQLYADTDIYVTPSWHEGYGMAAAEALAHGLPLVTTTAGALATTVPDAAALKCPPGAAAALRARLRQMLTDQPVREACAKASRMAGQRLPTWTDAARQVQAVLTAVSR
jgi:glycosyltransferase involved in cell wall biosynthesis